MDGLPTLEDLRHRIDVLTATLPDNLSRTDIATLVTAITLDGMADTIRVLMAGPMSSAAMADMATALRSMSDQLLDSIGE